ncbi:MAG: hypothetical protein ACLQBQ_00125 [Smithella sp.]
MDIKLYFSDVFNVPEKEIDEYGAFNVSLVTDLPLFVDPFLLFNSENEEYVKLHEDIINYLRFLKMKSESGTISRGLLKSWYYFSEVKQNWLGLSKSGNEGRGLGPKFASALNENLVVVFTNFGNEKITDGSHLEKLCLIRSGVGRDMVSDFTTNLIKNFLLKYTEKFTEKHIDVSLTKKFAVNRAMFDYHLERWVPRTYRLPNHKDDYVLLTPRDILTKDESWINHADMVKNFEDIPDAIENESLRAQINNYFYQTLPKGPEPTKEEYQRAIELTLRKFPQLIDYYIKQKEQNGDQAVAVSDAKVAESYELYIKQFGSLAYLLDQTEFYKKSDDTKEETREKIEFFKDVIENKGGHHIFYVKGVPVKQETDVHILFRLTWHKTISDVSREVDDGRGPADFKISRGAADKTIVEFKLASNSQLKRNLQKQLDIYKKASDAQAGFKVIIYFTEEQFRKVKKILEELNMIDDKNIYLIDARNDNKPTGSKA